MLTHELTHFYPNPALKWDIICQVIFASCFFPRIPTWNRVLNLCEWNFHKIIVRTEVYLVWMYVSNLCNCIFLDFDTLVNIAENVCTWKKPDIQYRKQSFQWSVSIFEEKSYHSEKQKRLAPVLSVISILARQGVNGWLFQLWRIPKGLVSYEHKVISQNDKNHTAGNNSNYFLNLRTFFPSLILKQ